MSVLDKVKALFSEMGEAWAARHDAEKRADRDMRIGESLVESAKVFRKHQVWHVLVRLLDREIRSVCDLKAAPPFAGRTAIRDILSVLWLTSGECCNILSTPADLQIRESADAREQLADTIKHVQPATPDMELASQLAQIAVRLAVQGEH